MDKSEIEFTAENAEKLDDLISRSALLKSLCNSCDGWRENTECDCLNCKSDHRCDMVEEIAEFPAVDPEEAFKNLAYVKESLEMAKQTMAPVRHGRWISEKCNHKPCRIKNPEKWVTYKCSECGYSNGRKQSNYCSRCGAKMDGGTDDG